MTIMWSYGLVFSGITMLSIALVPAARIAASLPRGTERSQWRGLFMLIVAFIVGYIGIALCCSEHLVGFGRWLVSVIFCFGGAFVLMVTRLAARTIGVMQRVAELEFENTTDALMGIYNRRFFDQRVREEFDRARRYGLEISLLLLDIDHFKKVNDEHGHRAGDCVLAETGALISDLVRSVDIPARYGGEEIALIAPSTSAEGAVFLAERIREQLEEYEFCPNNRGTTESPLKCTVSIGVATLRTPFASCNELVEAADQALYQAKELGRNRVIHFDDELNTSSDQAAITNRDLRNPGEPRYANQAG